MSYFTEQQRGANRKVLFEIAPKGGMMEGFTDNYIKVQTPYREEWMNSIVDWVV
jgi:threonylcarbamoyladenosine tRNA methylthiotransferase MtaB